MGKRLSFKINYNSGEGFLDVGDDIREMDGFLKADILSDLARQSAFAYDEALEAYVASEICISNPSADSSADADPVENKTPVADFLTGQSIVSCKIENGDCLQLELSNGFVLMVETTIGRLGFSAFKKGELEASA